MQEQAALFAGAEWVVGPHGAGFTNVAFCQPGCRILEWYPAGYHSLIFMACSCALDLNYACMAFPHDAPAPKQADFEVDTNRLMAALRGMGLDA